MNPQAPAPSTVMLDALGVYAQEHISRNLVTGLQRVKLQQHWDLVVDQLIVQLNAYVMAERLAEDERTFTFRWADGPWQRFKERHPRWSVTPPRYKVECRAVEVRSWATFPESTLRMPGLGAPIYFQQVSDR